MTPNKAPELTRRGAPPRKSPLAFRKTIHFYLAVSKQPKAYSLLLLLPRLAQRIQQRQHVGVRRTFK
jgi:hypothetical protein